jgi:uncharacterized membrane protein
MLKFFLTFRYLVVLPGLFLVVQAASARADFRLCNTTKNRVGIALGYQDGKNWVTEGWWNVSASSCETLLTGTLVARYFYVYALDYDQGGEWGGQAFLCTKDKEFTIQGVENCLARGFNKTGFFEVDTMEQRNWTVQLTDDSPTSTAAIPHPAPHPAPAKTTRPAQKPETTPQ